jgi:hypothetical protein
LGVVFHVPAQVFSVLIGELEGKGRCGQLVWRAATFQRNVRAVSVFRDSALVDAQRQWR